MKFNNDIGKGNAKLQKAHFPENRTVLNCQLKKHLWFYERKEAAIQVIFSAW